MELKRAMSKNKIPETVIYNIDDIRKNPDNPRFIKDKKFKKLVESIREFPEMLSIRPIVTDENLVILGGNMRLEACRAAGMKNVPVLIADKLTEDQKREFIIKDNLPGGEWDYDKLANEWDADLLDKWGFEKWEVEDAEVKDKGSEKKNKCPECGYEW